MTERRALHIALAVIGTITLIRLFALAASSLDFYPDEAQYWFWSEHPAFGYFSKPPLIAWIIMGAEAVCGQGEACVRAASPLLHGATALLIFALTRRLYDARTGLVAALAYITLPGVSYSAGLISTDVPLLFCWALALYALVRGMEEGKNAMGWAALAGVAIGLGLLAKYAMLYFVLGMVLAAIFHAPLRRMLLSPRGAITAVLALLVFSPNIFWNFENHFATVGHTASNANWRLADAFRLSHLGDFLLAQFGVFGPVMLAAYFYGIWRWAKGRDSSAATLPLICFSAPPLVLVAIQAFISEANANWAATTYIAATPLAAHVLMSAWPRWARGASFAFNGLVTVLMTLFLVSPAAIETFGMTNAYKRLRGWHELGAIVVQASREGYYEAVVTENRSVTAAMTYYARPLSIPLVVWRDNPVPGDHFAMTIPLTSAHRGRVLLVLDEAPNPAVLQSFSRTRLLGKARVTLGGTHERVNSFYEAEGYRGP